MNINGYDVVGRMPPFKSALRDLVRRGLKTETRRVIKPQPVDSGNGWFEWGYKFGAPKSTSPRSAFWHQETAMAGIGTAPIDEYCPYGHPGDICVMREPLRCTTGGYAEYVDDDAKEFRVMNFVLWIWETKTLPSIFMPTWAGRTLVCYTDIRAERLCNISRDDAYAEGITPADVEVYEGDSREAFRMLWNRINGKTHPWSSNPWVWVIEWKLLKPISA